MARQPAVVFRFMGAQVVQNDVNLLSGIQTDHVVHEVQELDTPAALGVLANGQLAGQHVEGGKQGGGTVAGVFIYEGGYFRARGSCCVVLSPLPAPAVGRCVPPPSPTPPP